MGQKRLEKAITQFRSNNGSVDVTWKPYMIDPATQVGGETFESYCRRRWGGSGWTNHLRSEGRKDGAKFQDWRWWPNTLKAHQLVKFAEERYGVNTSRSNKAIFNALYEEGKNVSLTDVLVQIGSDELGLPSDELRRYLENNEGADAVKEEIRRGRRMYKISGVPFFVVGAEGNGKPPYGFSGAQASETFLEVFEELTEQE